MAIHNDKNFRTFKRTVIATAIGVLLGNSVAYAQSTDDLFQTVIVTGTKRPENIQTVPIAITAVSGEELKEKGITDILSLEKSVPGLKIANSGNDPDPILRGAGVAGTTDIAIPFYVDGIYRPRSGQGLASYLDVDQIEILRGPQGTLFGRNTYGGLINITSKRPSTKATDYGYAVTLGNYASRKAEGFVNLPLGNDWAVRVTGSREKRDPYVENTFNPAGGLKDADSQYVRAQLNWKPSRTFSANLTATSWRDNANGNADYAYKCLGIPVNATSKKLDGVTGFIDPRCGTRDGWEGGRSQAGNVSKGDVSALVIADLYKVAFDFKPQREISEDSVSLRVDWEVANHNLTINAATFKYRELRLTDSDLSINPALVAGQILRSKANSLDVTLNSIASGPLRYTVGAYLYDDADAGGTNSAFLWGYTYSSPQKPSWATWLYQGNGGTKSTALYGQASYSLTEKLTATMGLRESRDERKSFTLPVDKKTLRNELPSYGGSPRVDNGTNGHTDWRVSGQYQLDKKTMLYVSGATGYIAGAVQALTNKLLDPQLARTYEAGIKTSMGRLRLNAALFKADYTGLTTTVFVQQGGTILAQQVPGGSTKASGLELEGQYAASDKFSLNFGIAATSSTFKKFNVSNTLGTVGSDFIDASNRGWFTMDGKKTSFSPDLTVNFGASYYLDLGGSGSLTPAMSASYSGSYRATNEPFFWSVQPSYVTLDLSTMWNSQDGKYTVRGFVNNVTNETVLTNAVVFSRGRAMADYSAPRTAGVRLSYNF